MNNNDCTQRQVLIYQFLVRKGKTTISEVIEMLMDHARNFGSDFTVCERTIRRDFKGIRDLFKVDIDYSSREKAYLIEANATFEAEVTQRIVESFEIIRSFQMFESLKNIIYFERVNSNGIEHLSLIINAIKQSQIISFEYNKNWNNQPTTIRLLPRVIREYRGRWYMTGQTITAPILKTYALDRIASLKIENCYKVNKLDISCYFKNCYGIYSPNDKKPEKTILRFSEKAIKYVKSSPIHFSQQILDEQNDSLTIQLTVFHTPDFIHDILAYGSQLVVISPHSLYTEIKKEVEKMSLLYK
ncbi:MAG: helix-turn-helix transcriptional regulator [Phocaeicola sp.]